MKTLAEQINEVLTVNKSKNYKRQELIKLGLTSNDIKTLFRVHAEAIDATTPAPIRRQRRNEYERTLNSMIQAMTFGVEIECYNVYQNSLIDAANRNGLQMHSEGYNHRDNNHYYKLVSDSSIRGVLPIECVSPILSGNESGFNSLEACCNSLNEIGARTNISTGLHIHVGCATMTDAQYVNTFINYQKLESVINSFMPIHRRGTHWAKSLQGYNFTTCNNQSDVAYLMHSDRYHAVNCESWGRHRTIEFRQHNGTTNYKHIAMWAIFCLKLVAWSANNRLENNITSVDDIPFLTASEKNHFKTRQNRFASVMA